MCWTFQRRSSASKTKRRKCLKLAEAEPQDGELRTILAGMAMAWLRLADYTRASQALEIEHSKH
jgi:hypothetical protein